MKSEISNETQPKRRLSRKQLKELAWASDEDSDKAYDSDENMLASTRDNGKKR